MFAVCACSLKNRSTSPVISSHNEPPPRVLFPNSRRECSKNRNQVFSLEEVATSRIAEFLAITNRGERLSRTSRWRWLVSAGEGENSSDSPAGERWDPLSRRPQRSYRRVGEGCVAADPTTTRAFLHRCTGASRCSSASSRSGLRVTRPRLGSQRKQGACVGRRRQLADSFRAATPSGTASV